MSPGSKNRYDTTGQRRLDTRESNLRMRARMIQSIRRFFINHGYLEIDTPNLIHSPAPEVYINAIRTSHGFLHTSPELCMKRLLSAGYTMIFQICKCYREGERGKLHLPEFTLLEWYRVGADYMGLMDECEEMIQFVAAEIGLGGEAEYAGNTIDLQGLWARITVKEAFKRYSTLSMEDALESERFDEIMVLEIEPGLTRSKPTFLYDYPSSFSALARLKEGNPDLAERFELYIGGLELANAFSELTDAHEQEERFKRARDRRKQLGKTDYPFPTKFIKDLYRMPASAGIAFGVDRLVMLFTDASRIDDVVSFTPEEL
ncbi:EF-P lysine aminoacylase EpmA [Thermodesulfobacteriota bacterium]